VGPWVYIASKNQWYNLSGIAAPQQTWWSVDYVPALRTARFGTYGRGIWDFKIGTYNSVEDIIAAGTGLTVSVYPNPCTGWLTVSSDELSGNKNTISILTLDGRMVKTIQPVTATSTRIDLSDVPAGIYVVTVSNGVKRQAVRVVRSDE